MGFGLVCGRLDLFVNDALVPSYLSIHLYIVFLCFLYTIDAAVTPFLNAYLIIDCLYFNSYVILFIWNTSLYDIVF